MVSEAPLARSRSPARAWRGSDHSHPGPPLATSVQGSLHFCANFHHHSFAPRANLRMRTLQEIKEAIAQLPSMERAVLIAELLASEPDPSVQELEAALERGMDDIGSGRTRPIGEVPGMIREWTWKA